MAAARPRKLENKIAVVTGGNSGIGLATATLFREEGATVVITASSAASYAKAKQDLGKLFEVVQVDVADLKQIDKLYEFVKSKYGKFDVLFANAGIAKFAPTLEMDVAKFDEMYNVNVKGLYFTVVKAIPLLNAGASVILNSSIASQIGLAQGDVYASTKAAVRSFARSWTAAFPPTQVRFNVLSPGITWTPLFERTMSKEQAQGFVDQMAASLPLKRAAQPEEMARSALFLASTDSSYVVGFDLVVDGGQLQV